MISSFDEAGKEKQPLFLIKPVKGALKQTTTFTPD